MSRLLIVDDDIEVLALLKKFFVQQGYQVAVATDGASLWAALEREVPDLIILDLMLPGDNGLTLCQRLRQQHATPVIMLTAMGELSDRVVGLEMGADDYLTKPFGMRELMARVRALLRRSARRDGGDESHIFAGSLELDLRGRTVRRDGREVALKPKEFDLLFFLAKNAGQVFTREQILERVWGYEFFGGSRTVDVHVRWLREKLEQDPARPRHLLTVRGVGYKFVR